MTNVPDKTSVIYESIDTSGNKKQRSITSVNPNASGVAMRQLAQGFVGLSNNTYSSARRVDTTDLANAVAKTRAAITATVNGAASITVTPVAYQGTTTDATSLIITLPSNYTNNPNCKIGVPYKTDSNWTIPIQNQGSFNVEVKIQTPETDNFMASNVATVTIPATV